MLRGLSFYTAVLRGGVVFLDSYVEVRVVFLDSNVKGGGVVFLDSNVEVVGRLPRQQC